MAEARTIVANQPVWVDLSSSDAAGSREFYSKLFGWQIEVNPDPQYGGYALAKSNGKEVAGVGPKMSPEGPTAWQMYIGTKDADELAKKVEAAGGKVIAPPFDVGAMGRMGVFQDPTGAFISAWQSEAMSFHTGGPNTFGWAELNARGVDKAIPFYKQVFGWSDKSSPMGEGGEPYTEFQMDGVSIAGGMEMNPMVPAQVPSYWAIYFNVDDVDGATRKAVDGGAQQMLAPQEFPGGRFSVLTDPQGALFGLLKMTYR